MKIFILGGTGFIGYHTIKALLPAGHQIGSLVLPDMEIGSWFPSEVELKYGNCFTMFDSDLLDMIRGFDVFIYAIGPDDRITPPAPADAFFHKYLVAQTERIAKIANQAGISRFILLNSYFAYFAEKWPKLQLQKHHPYIKSRILQAAKAIDAGKNTMDVIVLQLPYIFGVIPGRAPIWKDLFIKMLLNRKVIWFPDGGSNMIAVESVAKAIVGAISHGVHGKRYLIGDQNLTWKELFEIMLDELGMVKKVRRLPKWISKIVGWVIFLRHKRKGKESGLNPLHLFSDIEYRQFFFDPSLSQKELDFESNDLELSIRKSVRDSMKYLNLERKSKI